MGPLNFIVEIGQSHGGDMDRARKSLRDIAYAKSRAPRGINLLAKFQLFSPHAVFGNDKPVDWIHRKTMPEIKASLTENQYSYLLEYAAEHRLFAFASVFDSPDVDIVLKHHIDFHFSRFGHTSDGSRRCALVKLASRRNTHFELMREIDYKFRKCALTVVISDGNVHEKKAGEMFPVERAFGYGTEVVPLYCVPEYPHIYKENEIADLRKAIETGTRRGLSDHARFDDDVASLAAIQAGASWLERHYTDNRDMTEIDADCSMELPDLMRVLDEIGRIRDK